MKTVNSPPTPRARKPVRYVYVVAGYWAYETTNILAVYASKRGADKHVDRCKASHLTYDGYTVQHERVKS